jgi:hypothetical protein
MSPKMNDRNEMKRYLLGQTSAEQGQDLENQYVSNPNAFEELTEVENDLFDSYARGELSGLERQQFEQRYLSSQKGRARIAFSTALTEVSREPKQMAPEAGSWGWLRTPFSWNRMSLGWGLAAAAMLVLAIGSLRLAYHRPLQPAPPQEADEASPPQKPAEPPAQTPDRTSEQDTQIANAENPGLSEFTIQLSPGIARDATTHSSLFVIPPNATQLKFSLNVDNDDYAAYTAEVETADGKKIQSVGGLKRQLVKGKDIVLLRLPAPLFRSADYVIDLRADGNGNATKAPVESYSFRITRR